MARKDNEYLAEITSGQVGSDWLKSQTIHLLEDYDGWKLRADKKGVQIYTKKGVFGSITSVRYISRVKAGLQLIESFAYDQMLEHMPEWSKEFLTGERLKVIDDQSQLVRTKFKTPFFLKNREYVFHLSKHKTTDSITIIYCSISDQIYGEVTSGFIRSKLYPTIYRFTALKEGETQIEHILSTDLGHDLSLWFQNNSAVVNGVVKANIRDCLRIQAALGK